MDILEVGDDNARTRRTPTLARLLVAAVVIALAVGMAVAGWRWWVEQVSRPDRLEILAIAATGPFGISGADLPPGAAVGSLRIAGYEMLKGLEGIGTHDTFVEVPVFANTQDMTDLAARVRHRFAGLDWSAARPPVHGFLLSRHGLYTWGRDLAEARRHVEIHEFLFECVARARMLPS